MDKPYATIRSLTRRLGLIVRLVVPPRVWLALHVIRVNPDDLITLTVREDGAVEATYPWGRTVAINRWWALNEAQRSYQLGDDDGRGAHPESIQLYEGDGR